MSGNHIALFLLQIAAIPWHFCHAAPVQTWTWARFAEAKVLPAQPVKLTGSPLQTWLTASTDKWSLDRLAASQATFRRVHSKPGSGSGTFRYCRGQTASPLREILGIPADAECRAMRSESGERLFDGRAADAVSWQKHSYYFENLLRPSGAFEPPPLEVRQRLFAPLNRTIQWGGKTAEDAIMTWVGTAGSMTAMHYDDNHNIFLQVHGRKLFSLVPPRAVAALRRFPSWHGCRRQSQFDSVPAAVQWWEGQLEKRGGRGDCGAFDAPSGEAAADGCRATAAPLAESALADLLSSEVKVELGPGEALYLPPRWFHHVHAMTWALSLNVWFMSKLSKLHWNVFYPEMLTALFRLQSHQEEGRRRDDATTEGVVSSQALLRELCGLLFLRKGGANGAACVRQHLEGLFSRYGQQRPSWQGLPPPPSSLSSSDSRSNSLASVMRHACGHLTAGINSAAIEGGRARGRSLAADIFAAYARETAVTHDDDSGGNDDVAQQRRQLRRAHVDKEVFFVDFAEFVAEHLLHQVGAAHHISPSAQGDDAGDAIGSSRSWIQLHGLLHGFFKACF